MSGSPSTPGDDVAAASALDAGVRRQHDELRRRLAAGMPRAGWKICVNDRRMQKKLGIAAPFVGFLDGSRILPSDAVWKLGEGAVPGVEPEFAISFAQAVDPDGGHDAVRIAIAGVAPALEVVDWRDARLDLESLAAGSSFHAGVVVGAPRGMDDVPEIGDGCPRLHRCGEILGVPDASLVPRDLVALVRDVAVFLARYGQRIEAGDLVIAGSCTSPARVGPGDEIEADFATLGTVRVRFER